MSACSQPARERAGVGQAPAARRGAADRHLRCEHRCGGGLIASTRATNVAAIVSRGGRPDLAHACLPQVRVPTLLVVGSRDREVLELNRRAMQQMTAPTRLHIVEGAGHLFDEAGTLAEVTLAAATWFRKHLCAPTLHEQFGSAWDH